MTRRQNLGILLALALGLALGHFASHDVGDVHAQQTSKPLAGIDVDGNTIYKAYVDGSVEVCKVVQLPTKRVATVSAPKKVASVSVGQVDFFAKQATELKDSLKSRGLVCATLSQHR